ncbi:phosphatidylserine decarboxylase [Tardibacter chloracetimidivorans]|uniref:Phosphatidylserine decarboxylase proenzyme n=1 Tax=Tardibacter chloracetimidivorans TaxID=1921510 RepID=A0A1L3ZT69_9SPHN|nr:phosphatidylserine decarboxylase [Tardibacter chloracetimidivorans]API58833.1 phosphatidylserine decarboxylase [Tardibacter chloracetimidivorans]
MASIKSAPGTTVKYRMPSVHPEGVKFVVIAAVICAALAFFGWETLAWPMAGITLWVAAFFRDPVRATPSGEGVIASPADGLVTMIQEVTPPHELTSGEGGLEPEPVIRVSIFMSVFDVHINRAPVGGRVSRVVYVPGKFLNADLDKASDDNERQYFVVERPDGVKVGFTQIAGLVARRIVKFAKVGDIVVAGQRIGLIRFGSRVDVFLPSGTAPKVVLGQRAIAGETVLGIIGDFVPAAGVLQ